MYSLFLGKSSPKEFAALASSLKPVTGNISLWTEEQDLWSLVSAASSSTDSLCTLKEWIESTLTSSADYTSISTLRELNCIDSLDLEVLHEALFWLLVQGKLQEAVQLCTSSGNYWLAAIIGDFRASADSIRKLVGQSDSGRRLKWEKAFFSALLGENRQVLLQVCNNWKVELWVLIQTALNGSCEEAVIGEGKVYSFTALELIQMLKHEKSALFGVTATLLFGDFGANGRDLSFLFPLPSADLKESQEVRYFAFLAGFLVQERGFCFDSFFGRLSLEFLQDQKEDLLLALFFANKMHNCEGFLNVILQQEEEDKRKVFELIETLSPLEGKFRRFLEAKMCNPRELKTVHLLEWAIVCQLDNLNAYYESLAVSLLERGKEDFEAFYRVNQLIPNGKYSSLAQIIHTQEIQSLAQALEAIASCEGKDWFEIVVSAHLLPLIGVFVERGNVISSGEFCRLLGALKDYGGHLGGFLSRLALPMLKVELSC